MKQMDMMNIITSLFNYVAVTPPLARWELCVGQTCIVNQVLIGSLITKSFLLYNIYQTTDSDRLFISFITLFMK